MALVSFCAIMSKFSLKVILYRQEFVHIKVSFKRLFILQDAFEKAINL